MILYIICPAINARLQVRRNDRFICRIRDQIALAFVQSLEKNIWVYYISINQ